MKRKLLHDLSANSLQVIINQLCGLGIFFVLSTWLDKNSFGEVNWSLAVLLTLFGVLSFGIDQVFVRRIAAGDSTVVILPVYIFHVLISGVMLYGIMFLGEFLFPPFFQKHFLLLLLGAGKLMIFISTPFKQLATGLEQFRPLLFMSVCSNVLRSVALLFFAISGGFSISGVVIIFIAGDLAELLLCIFISSGIMHVPLRLRWNRAAYAALLRESLPQLGVSVFTSAIARFDWIFLGVFASNIILADYSFAYKVFEMATLPMLVIAPILIPRFTKMFHPGAGGVLKPKELYVLLRLEIMIASATSLILNLLWVPVIDFITSGKYGAINRNTIFLLSASIPFLYYNNFLWTINFAKGHLKMIFYIFAVTFLVNILADVGLIPFYNGAGAAAGYLLAIIAQSAAYLRYTKLGGLTRQSISLLLSPASAFAAGYISSLLFNDTLLVLSSAVIIFLCFLLLSGQIRRDDWPVIKRMTGI